MLLQLLERILISVLQDVKPRVLALTTTTKVALLPGFTCEAFKYTGAPVKFSCNLIGPQAVPTVVVVYEKVSSALPLLVMLKLNVVSVSIAIPVSFCAVVLAVLISQMTSSSGINVLLTLVFLSIKNDISLLMLPLIFALQAPTAVKFKITS